MKIEINSIDWLKKLFLKDDQHFYSSSAGVLFGCFNYNVTRILYISILSKFRFSAAHIINRSLFGLCGIILSSINASITFITSSSYIADHIYHIKKYPLYSFIPLFILQYDAIPQDYKFSKYVQKSSKSISYKHIEYITYSMVGIIMLYLSGRNILQFAPSNIIHKGAFGKTKYAIESNGANYANQIQRKKLQLLGRKHGCHHCGTTISKLYHGDHIPPNKYAPFFLNY